MNAFGNPAYFLEPHAFVESDCNCVGCEDVEDHDFQFHSLSQFQKRYHHAFAKTRTPFTLRYAYAQISRVVSLTRQGPYFPDRNYPTANLRH